MAGGPQAPAAAGSSVAGDQEQRDVGKENHAPQGLASGEGTARPTYPIPNLTATEESQHVN